jgi:hypothetical protein
LKYEKVYAIRWKKAKIKGRDANRLILKIYPGESAHDGMGKPRWALGFGDICYLQNSVPNAVCDLIPEI